MLRAMRRASIHRAILAAVGLAIAAVGPAGCAHALPPSLGHSLVGNAAPEFHETSTLDRDVGVPGGMRTKVTVVDFWASWCGTCQQSIPELDALYRDRRDDGVMVIGVSVDEAKDDAIAAANRLHATFPIVHDPRMSVAGSYRVANVPITFVVDRRGTVRWVGRDPGDVKRAVEFVLSE